MLSIPKYLRQVTVQEELKYPKILQCAYETHLAYHILLKFLKTTPVSSPIIAAATVFFLVIYLQAGALDGASSLPDVLSCSLSRRSY